MAEPENPLAESIKKHCKTGLNGFAFSEFKAVCSPAQAIRVLNDIGEDSSYIQEAKDMMGRQGGKPGECSVEVIGSIDTYKVKSTKVQCGLKV